MERANEPIAPTDAELRELRAVTADMAWSSAKYALIDSAQTDPDYWEDLQALPVVPLSHPGRESLFPALADLQESDNKRALVRERERRWERHEQTPYLMALLDTPEPASALVEHLTRRMGISRPNGRIDALRYYDPYVFRNLLWLFTPEQMDCLLGPIETWYWREPDGFWQRYERQGGNPGIAPLRLTPKQWPTLLRMAEINTVARKLEWIGVPDAWRPRTMQRIDVLLAQARAQGLNNSEDRSLYARQAIRFNRDIHQHPVLRNCLKRAVSGETSYRMACRDLNDMRMFQLSEELR
jgi:hypothetical protein